MESGGFGFYIKTEIFWLKSNENGRTKQQTTKPKLH